MDKTAILSEPVSILMPVCNESDVIRDVVDEWARDVIRFLPAGSELVFDDCSSDGTDAILAELAATIYPFIRVNRTRRDGFGAAAKRLYATARCPLIFFTDSDGQYMPEDFWTVAAALPNADMVHGYKVGRQDPLYRIVASAVFTHLAHLFFGSRGHDVNSAFRLMRRDLVETLVPDVCRLPVQPNAELYIRAESLGWRVIDIPVRHRQRLMGISRGLPPKTFLWEGWRSFIGLFLLKRDLATAPRRRQ